jgi:hypothetical protein
VVLTLRSRGCRRTMDRNCNPRRQRRRVPGAVSTADSPTSRPYPPAANATFIVIDRVGYVCARAIRDSAGSAATPAAWCRNRRRGIFIAAPTTVTVKLHHLSDGAEGVALTAFGISCRRCGHALSARFDPNRSFLHVMGCKCHACSSDASIRGTPPMRPQLPTRT